MDKYVFISYSHQDRDYVHALADDLSAHGFDVWLDDLIDYGDRWFQTIVEALYKSAACIVVMTPAAEESEWVDREVQLALREQKPIFPLLLQGKEFPILITRQYCDVKGGKMPPPAFYERLAREVPALGVQQPAPLVPESAIGKIITHSSQISEPGVAHLAGRETPPVEPPKTAEEPAPRVEEKAEASRAAPAVATLPRTVVGQPFEPELILIPAGEFLMGSDPADARASTGELPQHRLYLPDYYIAKTPITNAQFLAFVEATGHQPPGHWRKRRLPEGKEDHPVVNVSWHNAMEYCQWLSKVTGKWYRLPSEAEWEKAARGTDGRIYPWGDQWDPERCNAREGGKGGTTPVGQYSPQGDSPYGCADMAGNVWEWTRSLYKSYPYDPTNGREDLGTGGDVARVVRGGSYVFNRDYARCSSRSKNYPDNRFESYGIRVVVSPISSSGL